MALRGGEAGDDHHHCDDDQGDDGDDLDHGEPELDLAEQSHGDQVEPEQQGDQAGGSEPLRYVGPPVLHIGGDRGQVGDADHDPAEPVGPAGEEARPRAEN